MAPWWELLMAWARSIMSFVFINKVCCIFQFSFHSLCNFLSEMVPAPFFMFPIYFTSLDPWTIIFLWLFLFCVAFWFPLPFHCFSLHSLLLLLTVKMEDIQVPWILELWGLWPFFYVLPVQKMKSRLTVLINWIECFHLPQNTEEQWLRTYEELYLILFAGR